jgi:hypothetical protein
MGVTTNLINKPFNPRAQDQSPKGYNRAALYSGKALDFDGVNDYVQCDNLDTLYSSDFTISYFFKWESTGDNWGVTQGQNGTNQSIITGKQNSGVIRFAFWGNDLDAPVSLTPAQNEWAFLSFTYNRTTKERKIYINGILAAEDVSAANPNPTASTFQISAFTTIGGYYNNQVSNVKVFNTALTAAQVADLYNNPEKVVPTGVDNTALKLWLPMMEGAGTTAYDGSGNGNHGTISGATYVNGIGAPSPQSAVMDWNKGVNILDYSNDFTDSSWLKLAAGGGSIPTITANYTTGPSEKNDASRLQASNTGGGGGDYSIVQVGISTSTTDAAAGVWVKSNTGSNQTIYFRADGGDQHSTALVTTEWTRIEKTGLSIASTIYSTIGLRGSATGTSSIDISIWGASLEKTASVGPYVYTNGTAQTSEVLLPQGLTTGRDITGVNLFENVRKQGALNLDGNSWAEVHDNASVDLTTGATLECWYKWGTQLNAGLLGRWDYPNNQRSLLILHGALDNARLLFSFDGTNAAAVEGTSTPADGTWVHIAGTYDGTTFRLYVNATQEATASSTGVLFNSPDSVEIGRHGYGALDETNGSIAQPRIYNRALTASEVLRNYNSGKNTYTND